VATPRIKAIFFDAVGTLLHPEPSAAVVYADVGRRFGSNYNIDTMRGRFAAAFRSEEEADRTAGWSTSEERERRRWRTIVGNVLDDVSDADQCFAELYEHFARPAAWRLDPEAGRVIERLAPLRFRLGLASNYDQRLHTVAAGFPAFAALKHIVVSSEVGWRKPARGFFEALCRAARVPAEQILHVGDDPANDYEGATTAGLRAVLFDPLGKHGAFAGDRLRHLSDLLAYVHSSS
jgi:putative hydrolase of the HAD superfamily